MNFELERTRVHIVNVHPRRELRGDEHVPAVDVKLRLETGNVALSMFDGWLLTALYHRSGAPADNPQYELDGLPKVTDWPNRRFPAMGPLHWNDEARGYTLRIDNGIGSVELDDCAINAFLLECKEGGTVVLTWRVQCDHIDEHAIGRLCCLIDVDCDVTLVRANDGRREVDGASNETPKSGSA